MKKCIFVILGLLSCVVFASAQMAAASYSECPLQTPEQILKDFYQTRSRGYMQEITGNKQATYSYKYDLAVAAVYPPTFLTDRIACVPPYDKEGALFTFVMQEIYEQLKQSAPLDVAKLAEQTLAAIVVSTRDIDITKLSGPQAEKGDIWYEVLALKGLYDQFDLFLGAETVLDKNVFTKRRTDIKNFAVSFSDQSYDFIVKVLRPLETVNPIEGADVEKYIQQHLPKNALPRGIDYNEFVDNLLQTIAGPSDFLEQAEQMNPSLEKELNNAWKGLRDLAHFQARTEDVFAVLNLFQYTFPSTYIKMLQNASKGQVSHAEINQALAEALAAEALNKRIAQTANDLFEVERIFYYPAASVGDYAIGANWQRLAENDHYAGSMITRLAGDNLLRSGKRKYQTNKIVALRLQERHFAELSGTVKAGEETILFGIDLAFPIGVEKLLTGTKAITKAAQAAQTTAQMQREGALAVKSAGKSTKAAKPAAVSVRQAVRKAAVKVSPSELIQKIERMLNSKSLKINKLEKLKTWLETSDPKALGEVAKEWGHFGKNIKEVEQCIQNAACLNKLLDELYQARGIFCQITGSSEKLSAVFPQSFFYRSGKRWATETTAKTTKEVRALLDALEVNPKDVPYLYKNGKIIIGESRNLKSLFEPIAKQQRKLLREKGLNGTQYIRWGKSEFTYGSKGIDHIHIETVVRSKEGGQFVWNMSFPVELVNRELWWNEALFAETIPISF